MGAAPVRWVGEGWPPSYNVDDTCFGPKRCWASRSWPRVRSSKALIELKFVAWRLAAAAAINAYVHLFFVSTKVLLPNTATEDQKHLSASASIAMRRPQHASDVTLSLTLITSILRTNTVLPSCARRA